MNHLVRPLSLRYISFRRPEAYWWSKLEMSVLTYTFFNVSRESSGTSHSRSLLNRLQVRDVVWTTQSLGTIRKGFRPLTR